MSSLSDSQIRHSILELLYLYEKDKPADVGIERTAMMGILGITENDMDFNIFYLHQKHLVALILAGGAPWMCAKITAFGIDVIENKEKFTMDFPFINTTIHVQGNNYGNILQATSGSTVNFSQQVCDSFKIAFGMIETKDGISDAQKEEVRKNTKLLEEELSKSEKDVGKIQKSWQWIQQNASWLVPTLSQVIIEGVKMALGIK